jgi:hypothetical protein
MKGKGDNPIVGSETTDIYDGENHGYKENNSLEKDDLRAFATHWTWRTIDSCHCLLSTVDHQERVISF